MTTFVDESETAPIPGENEYEIWELTVPGRVSMTVEREFNKPRHITGRGKKSRIRLTAKERRIVQEGIVRTQDDPFKNGKLVRVEADGEVPVRVDPPALDEMDDETLKATFALDETDFEDTVKALSKVNVERLRRDGVDWGAKASQMAWLSEYYQEAWPIGGSVPSYDELQNIPASAVGN